MKQTHLNSSGNNPNYLNNSTTSREISYNEITATEGSLSDALKDFRIICEDDFYLGDEVTVYNELKFPQDSQLRYSK